MKDDVPEAEKWRRFRVLEELQEKIAAEINARYQGETVEILFEDKVRDRWRGRTPTNKLVFVESNADLRGQVRKATITWTGPWSMQAAHCPAVRRFRSHFRHFKQPHKRNRADRSCDSGDLVAQITPNPIILHSQQKIVVANSKERLYKHSMQDTLLRQFEELRVLHSVAKACVEATNEDALIERVTEIIGAAFFPDNFGVLLLDESAKIVHRHPSYRERIDHLPYDTMPLGEGITSKTILTGQPVLVSDVRQRAGLF